VILRNKIRVQDTRKLLINKHVVMQLVVMSTFLKSDIGFLQLIIKSIIKK